MRGTGWDLWRGHGCDVLSVRGRVDGADRAVQHAGNALLVVDLLGADLTETDAVVALLRALAARQRTGRRSLVVNAAPDVAVALRPVRVPVGSTVDAPPALPPLPATILQ